MYDFYISRSFCKDFYKLRSYWVFYFYFCYGLVGLVGVIVVVYCYERNRLFRTNGELSV